MAKISKSIVEITETIKEINFQGYANTRPPKIFIRKFIKYIEECADDKRYENMCDYTLEEIIVLAFIAILAGATTWIDISTYGEINLKWFKRFLPLKQNKVPSHDTFRRVLGIIDSEQLLKATVEFIMSFLNRYKKLLGTKKEDYRLISIDGKEGKGTGRKYNTDEEIRNLQTMHVYDSSNGIVLASEIIDRKTNEIPVGQKILSNLNLDKTIITSDAMNTQKKLTQIVIERKGDYLLGLKGNSGYLYDSIQGTITTELLAHIKKKQVDYYQTEEKAHSQTEKRAYYMISAKQFVILERDEWSVLRNIICYQKTITKNEKTKIETRYYITSLNDVELCAEAIRGHWKIENQLHWYLDTVFDEDRNTTMDKHAYNNFSILRKMALSFLKLIKPQFKCGMATIQKCFGWNSSEVMSKILNFLTSEEIRTALASANQKQKNKNSN